MHRRATGMTLPVPRWSDAFKTGIRVIDNDHKMLFEITEALVESANREEAPEALGDIIACLVDYADGHFRREEAFMAKCRFPDLHAHWLEHQRATEHIHEIRDLYRSDPDQVDTAELAAFFTSWLIHHIQDSDQRYVPYVRGEKSAADEAASPDAGKGSPSTTR